MPVSTIMVLMLAAIYILVALIGATISVHHKKKSGQSFSKIDTYLVWWLVVIFGVGSIIGALFHLFDGAQTAEQIGYTRGDGGFQFENAMGDMAIGVAACLSYRFRGLFWLALIIIASIQFLGDAGGHIHFWIDGDTKPDNIGSPLVLDIIGPIVAIALYSLSWRRGGDAHPQ